MTTTKTSVLDKIKLQYEEMPLKRKPKKAVTFRKLLQEEKKIEKALKPTKAKQVGFIKGYFKYLVEVILK